ncbi:MAG: Cro/Cl family transcriptional regulator [Candidatus Melainabacteria bacterium RIFOXYA12_FULL_32_12]|nr:MAG: Cro/Cl family transcriptional regulator [Candidatus Melainabacteria bacterium RIFOXYA12_FULL_32_12]
MIKSHLSKIMGEKRITIKEVHEKTGLSRNTISNLYNEKTKMIDFDTLDKLCEFLNCSVCDLLEHIKN